MTSSTPETTPIAQAVVIGDLESEAPLTAHTGTSEFPVGGPDGRGGTTSGPNPYDLLSASLAACTAMTLRLHARLEAFFFLTYEGRRAAQHNAEHLGE